MRATAPDFLPEKSAWHDLTSVGMVDATRELNGKTSTEVLYYLSSLTIAENLISGESSFRKRFKFSVDSPSGASFASSCIGRLGSREKRLSRQ